MQNEIEAYENGYNNGIKAKNWEIRKNIRNWLKQGKNLEEIKRKIMGEC